VQDGSWGSPLQKIFAALPQFERRVISHSPTERITATRPMATFAACGVLRQWRNAHSTHGRALDTSVTKVDA
jgi:hypothetical protein